MDSMPGPRRPGRAAAAAGAAALSAAAAAEARVVRSKVLERRGACPVGSRSEVPIGANRSNSGPSRPGGIAKLGQTGPSLGITVNSTVCLGP